MGQHGIARHSTAAPVPQSPPARGRPDASEAAQTLQEELEKLESQAQEREEVLKAREFLNDSIFSLTEATKQHHQPCLVQASRASPIGQSLGGM